MPNAHSFNREVQGKPVRLYTITGGGLLMQVTNYGAKIVSLMVPDANGRKADIVLGFSTLEEWLSQETYFNGINGRCTGRVSGGRFSLDGTVYELVRNSGENALHGGLHGFNEKVWDVQESSAQHVTMHYRSEAGEEGYPGNLDVWVTYRLTGAPALNISYKAVTDAPTILNLTNHAYFNLKGEGEGDIRDHRLQVFADEYIPYDETVAPTGEVLPVEGTPMDFRDPVTIADRIDTPFFAMGRGIDNGWALPGWREYRMDTKRLQRAAVLSGGGRTMEVWTTFPCMQVYSGNYVERHVGKSGRMYDVQHAVCLEAQGFPDSINHPLFPSPVLRPGETFSGVCEYRFSDTVV